jgi:hypothetical protein
LRRYFRRICTSSRDMRDLPWKSSSGMARRNRRYNRELWILDVARKDAKDSPSKFIAHSQFRPKWLFTEIMKGFEASEYVLSVNLGLIREKVTLTHCTREPYVMLRPSFGLKSLRTK